MRIPGYCTECRRFKQVKVSGAGIAMMAQRGTPSGICTDCELREVNENAERFRQQRRMGGRR